MYPTQSVASAGNFTLQHLPEVRHRKSVKTNVAPLLGAHFFRLAVLNRWKTILQNNSILVSYKLRTELGNNSNYHYDIRYI
jgi:hypothetical protein